MSTKNRIELRQELEIARSTAKIAEEAYNNCNHGSLSGCEHQLASENADAEVERIESMLRDPATPGLRTWRLIEEGHAYDTVEAESAEDALEVARGNVSRANYPTDDDRSQGTIWIDVRVHCEETDEEDSDTVECGPEEPGCAEDEHDWQAPHEIVGGIKENPGVWGHGGGVLIHEVCVHCGCGRTTDTWAQRPDTGEQGLRSVKYEPGKYREAIKNMRAEEAK